MKEKWQWIKNNLYWKGIFLSFIKAIQLMLVLFGTATIGTLLVGGPLLLMIFVSGWYFLIYILYLVLFFTYLIYRDGAY